VNSPTCNGNNSTTTISTESLEELARMLALAGVPGTTPSPEITDPGMGPMDASEPKDSIPVEEPAVQDNTEEEGPVEIADESEDYGNEPSSRKGYEVADPRDVNTVSANAKVRYTPARSGDNPMAEDEHPMRRVMQITDESASERDLADTYHGHRAEADHGEALARTADEHGVAGEDVERAVRQHKAYEGIAKGFMDYLKEVQAAKEVDEAYGARTNRRTGHTTYAENSVALLPITGPGAMVNLDGLGDNEYARMNQPNEGIVGFAIEVGGGKKRLTFASSAGNVESRYKPGTNVLTYHDQNGAERPGTVLFSFDSDRYQSPEGRAQIETMMRNAGMDPKKKYSLRVFK
jgi:hypothetical protein